MPVVAEEGEGAMNLDASIEVASWVWGVEVRLVEETTSGSATSEALSSINDTTMDDNSFAHQSLRTKTHKDAYTGTHCFLKYQKMHIGRVWYSILSLHTIISEIHVFLINVPYLIHVLSY